MSLSQITASANFKIVVCVILLWGVFYGGYQIQNYRRNYASNSPYTVQQLIDAVEADDAALVKKILARTPHLKFQDSELPPSLALNAAIETQNLEMLFLLLDHGIEVNCPRKKIVTRHVTHEEDGDHTHTSTKVTEKPLEVAISMGDLSVVKLLIRRGAKIEECYRPLFYAVKHHNVEVARYLIDMGVKDQMPENKPYMSMEDDILWQACPDEELVKCLLEQGYQWQYNWFSVSDDTYASGRLKPGEQLIHNTNSLGIIESLLQAGIDIDTQDSEGRTALHLAVIRGSRERRVLPSEASDSEDDEGLGLYVSPNLALFLIDRGANPCILDHAGKTPADYASDSFRREYAHAQWTKNAYGWKDGLFFPVGFFYRAYSPPDKPVRKEPCSINPSLEPPKW